jgi:hypothetical protein
VDAIFEFCLKTSEQEDGVEALEGKKIKLKYVKVKKNKKS